MKVCEKCKVEYSDEKKFCRRCGAHLVTKKPPAEKVPDVKTQISDVGTSHLKPDESLKDSVASSSEGSIPGKKLVKRKRINPFVWILAGLAFVAVLLLILKFAVQPKVNDGIGDEARNAAELTVQDRSPQSTGQIGGTTSLDHSGTSAGEIPSNTSAHQQADSRNLSSPSVPDNQNALSVNRPARLPLPKAPWVQRNVCPFEGCQYGTWIAKENMFVYEDQNVQSKITGQIQKGEQVQALRGDMVFDRLGIVVVNDSFDRFLKGDSIAILSYLGEGDYSIWNNGKMESVAIFWRDDSRGSGWTIKGTLITSPIAVWWVNVKLASGKTGWVDNTKNRFSGSDKFD